MRLFLTTSLRPLVLQDTRKGVFLTVLPQGAAAGTLTAQYNDLESVKALFEANNGEVLTSHLYNPLLLSLHRSSPPLPPALSPPSCAYPFVFIPFLASFVCSSLP
eukprot:755733-Hanusia_phi.AAC.2